MEWLRERKLKPPTISSVQKIFKIVSQYMKVRVCLKINLFFQGHLNATSVRKLTLMMAAEVISPSFEHIYSTYLAF